MTCQYPECEPSKYGTICKPECVLERAHERAQQNITTHAYGCWSWGPRHYLCALNEISRLKSELESNQ